MVAPVQIQVFDQEQLAFSDEFEGTVELGRQAEQAEDVYKGRLEGDRWRVAIARLKEQFVSRRHALLVPLEGGLVRLTNTSSLIPLTLADGTELAPRATVDLPMPATLSIGRKQIVIKAGDTDLTL